MKTAVPELKENSQRHTNLKGKGRRELKLAIAEFEGEKSASYKVRGKGRWEVKTAIPELKRIVSVIQIYKRKGDGK